MDEPTAMLDPESRKEVIRIIRRLNQEKGITVILITHHTEEVIDADMIVLMEAGKVLKTGSPREIFRDVELLHKVKMDVPQITELSRRLRKDGIKLSDPILTEEQFLEEFKATYRGKSGRFSMECKEAVPKREKIIELKNVIFSYGKHTNEEKKILNNVSFSVCEGEFFQYPEQQLFGRTVLADVCYGPLNMGMSQEDF